MIISENFISALDEMGISYSLNEAMKNHTSFKIGGSADIFISLTDAKRLAAVVRLCRDNRIPLTVIGNGSNMLVSDNGIDGCVLKIDDSSQKPELTGDTKIYCPAGVSMISLCRFALEHCLGGLEFAYGIPGTLGGGMFMNAGAYNGQLKDVVTRCYHINPDGSEGFLEADELELGYRYSIYQKNGCIITGVEMQLEKRDYDVIKDRMDTLMFRRRDKQPLEYPSAGSVFKRPEGYFAGALIEQNNLKGCRIGGAMVSEKHAGFIINVGGATCKDVTELIRHIQDTVMEADGVMLECEIKAVGR